MPTGSRGPTDSAWEHIDYEADQAVACAMILEAGALGLLPEVRNALLESALIHVRAIADFLSAKKSKPDDMVPGDFLAMIWAKPGLLPKDVDRRINKEVAHLTYSRWADGDPKKDWNLRQTFEPLLKALEEFYNAAQRQFPARPALYLASRSQAAPGVASGGATSPQRPFTFSAAASSTYLPPTVMHTIGAAQPSAASLVPSPAVVTLPPKK